ncbi:hypothetical protein VC35_13340 [Pseudomonas fluorescens]|uniref:Uncharacterized protein n=1 Tax=Pseudomonas fluorescens TaxID=294 RepID=A0A0F4TQ17_PSEFL|nr:hypothetical protein VC35_13340 [Pseudomonas fluorescens]
MGRLYFKFQTTDEYLYRAEFWLQKAKDQGVKDAESMLEDAEDKLRAQVVSAKKEGTWNPWEKRAHA